MKLMIHELPLGGGQSPHEERTLRHWLTMEDGRIFYQDEFLTWRIDMDPIGWETRRGPWHQLPTPEPADVVVSAIWDRVEENALVFMRSGRVWQFAYKEGDHLPHFHAVIDAVPHSVEDLKNAR